MIFVLFTHFTNDYGSNVFNVFRKGSLHSTVKISEVEKAIFFLNFDLVSWKTLTTIWECIIDCKVGHISRNSIELKEALLFLSE